MFMHNYIEVAMLLSINQRLITKFWHEWILSRKKAKGEESIKNKSNAKSLQSNRPQKQQTNKQIDVQSCLPTKQ
jgi:hypothetical protein